MLPNSSGRNDPGTARTLRRFFRFCFYSCGRGLTHGRCFKNLIWTNRVFLTNHHPDCRHWNGDTRCDRYHSLRISAPGGVSPDGRFRLLSELRHSMTEKRHDRTRPITKLFHFREVSRRIEWPGNCNSQLQNRQRVGAALQEKNAFGMVTLDAVAYTIRAGCERPGFCNPV